MQIKHYILFFSVIMLAGNCTLSPFNGSSSIVTEDDLEAASLILGDDFLEGSGSLSISVQDAIAIIAGNTIYPKTMAKTVTKEKSSFDFIQSYTTFYEEDSGRHTLIFTRQSYDDFSMEQDTLSYIYWDNNGDFIPYPMELREQISSILFEGRKKGSIHGNRGTDTLDVKTDAILKNRFYEQKSTFFVSGFNSRTHTLSLEGTHLSQGFTEYLEKDKTRLNRYHEMSVELLNPILYYEEPNCEREDMVENEPGFNPNQSFNCRDAMNIRLEGNATINMKMWLNSEKQGTPVNLSGNIEFMRDNNVVINFENVNERLILRANKKEISDELGANHSSGK